MTMYKKTLISTKTMRKNITPKSKKILNLNQNKNPT